MNNQLPTFIPDTEAEKYFGGSQNINNSNIPTFIPDTQAEQYFTPQNKLKVNPLPQATKEGKLFTTAYKDTKQQVKDTYGPKSFLYAATLPARVITHTGAAIADAVSSGTQKLGAASGEGIAAKKNMDLYLKAMEDYNKGLVTYKDNPKALSMLVKPKLEDFVGVDTARRINETAAQNRKEILGLAGQTVLEATSGGLLKLYKPTSVATNSFKLVKPTVQTAEEIAKAKAAYKALPGVEKFKKGALSLLKDTAVGVGYGEAYDITQNLQNQEQGSDIFTKGGGKYIGAAAPTVFKGIGATYTGTKNAFTQAGHIEGVKDFWMKAMTQNKPEYNPARNIYNKATKNNVDIGQILVDYKINPYDSIDGGKFKTTDAANSIYADNAKMSTEVLRPSLEIANSYTPKVPLETIKNDAIDYVMSNPNIINREEATRKIESKFTSTGKNSLQERYPNGMSLTDLHDERILHTNNYESTSFDNEINKDIANSLRDNLVKSSPKEIGVENFQKELSQRYQAADYIAKLNGKNVPIGFGKKFMIGAGKIIGTGVGADIGGILGGVAGYHSGGTLTKLILDMPFPFRQSALENLKVSNPEAFDAVINYIGKENIRKMTGLKLPPPTPLGETGNPIITPSPTTYEAQSPKIMNQNKLRDPLQGLRLPAPNRETQGYYDPNSIKIAPQGFKGDITSKKGIINQRNLSQSPSVANPISNANINTPKNDIIPSITQNIKNVPFKNTPNNLADFTIKPSVNKLPDTNQLVSKTKVKDFLKSLGEKSINMKVITKNGNLYMTYDNGINKVNFRPSAFGLSEENIKPGNEININLKDLKGSGAVLRLFDKNNLQKGLSSIKSMFLGTIGLGSGIGLLKIPGKTLEINNPEQQEVKTINDDNLAEILRILESSDGQNNRNQDGAEMRWVYGISPIAKQDLIDNKIKTVFNDNDVNDVKDTAIKFFRLLQKRFPNETPAEIYINHYWTQGTPEQNKEKIELFNSLVK